MPIAEIFGVDYSGAESDKDTWLSRGTVNGQTLELAECRSISRADLTELLAGQVKPAIVAMDFPFGVPQEFARSWVKGANMMPELWRAAASTTLDGFIQRRHQLVNGGPEPRRVGDLRHKEAFSPLHEVNPNMLPMTFYGMRMLAALKLKGWAVPPLDSGIWEFRVLLEAMPGATLKALGLPYKGYKAGRAAPAKRMEILDGLAERAGVTLKGPADLGERCLANHDALDSVVAAVTAALWAVDPAAFLRPDPEQPDEVKAAKLEGWLYAPLGQAAVA